MPITLTAPEGVLTSTGERDILPRLSVALLEAAGLTGNSFFTPIVGGTVHILPPHRIYAGGGNRPIVMVELKLPNIGLASIEARGTFISAAAKIVAELCVPSHEPENTWINIVNAPDGGLGHWQPAICRRRSDRRRYRRRILMARTIDHVTDHWRRIRLAPDHQAAVTPARSLSKF